MQHLEVLSSQQFNIGAIVSCWKDHNLGDFRASVWKDNGIYQVGGYNYGVHFRSSHRTKAEAYTSARRVLKG